MKRKMAEYSSPRLSVYSKLSRFYANFQKNIAMPSRQYWNHRVVQASLSAHSSLNYGYGATSSSSAGYLIENHLICITFANSDKDSATTTTAAFERVIRSFQDSRTQEFISCYFGNSAMNATELNYMLPIYTNIKKMKSPVFSYVTIRSKTRAAASN